MCLSCVRRTPGYEIENQTKPQETRSISKGAGILEPDQVAAALIKGVQKGRKMIIPGFEAKVAWYLKRWAPGLINSIMDRAVLKIQNKGFVKPSVKE